MALTKVRLGELIELSEDTNAELKYSLANVKGISIQKTFIETKADMQGVSLHSYYLVKPDSFAYVTVTSRNGEKITLAHNDTDKIYIVSSSYIVFKVKCSDLLLSDYLFMYFNRPEFDRYTRFNSWGSARETFTWEDMCDITLSLPPLSVQQKYVNIYQAMLKNQKCYEQGLDDLKLVCDGYMDKLKHNRKPVAINEYIVKTDIRNTEKQPLPFKGLSMENFFIDSIANEIGLDFSKYKMVFPDDFACVLMKVGRDCRLTVAHNNSNETYLISPAYFSFKLKGINSDFFMAYISRSEFERRAWFSCDTSARGSLSWEEFCLLQIPNAIKEEQQIIANIYNIYNRRKQINEQLKKKLKEICPVLIKGSIEEG